MGAEAAISLRYMAIAPRANQVTEHRGYDSGRSIAPSQGDEPGRAQETTKEMKQVVEREIQLTKCESCYTLGVRIVFLNTRKDRILTGS